MEKLEIKQLKGYLGTGLKILDAWGDIRLMKYTHLDDDGNNGVIHGIKPILRPLSDLTKEELSEFSVNFMMHRNHESFDYRLMIYSDIELCFKHHLDIYELVEKGLAISTDTLTDNPY